MRYEGREILTTGKKDFSTALKRRQRDSIEHYDSMKLNELTELEQGLLTSDMHYWQFGDRYYKLSLQYYGTIGDWDVIAIHNQKPTEAHVKIGDQIEIPFPLSLAKRLYGI